MVREPATLDPLQTFTAQYLEWIAAHGFSDDTVNTRRAYLGYFHEWCQERGLNEPIEITRPILERLSALALSLPQDQRPAARAADTYSWTVLWKIEQLRAIWCWLNPSEWSLKTSFNLRMVSLFCGNGDSPLFSGIHLPRLPCAAFQSDADHDSQLQS